MRSRAELAAAYEAACRAEIEALKPGNVHVFADGHRMSAADFLASAQASAAPLTDPDLPVGRRMLAAVSATREAVGTNTNLGIILLCAPLLKAAEAEGELRANLGPVLAGFDMEDTAAVFAAIALAAPGGLGSAGRHDVRRPPDVLLIEAMRAAAGRDRIARQYATGFADVFDTGVAALRAARARGETGMWPAVFAYMTFLARFPDSHVVRKFDELAAAALKAEAIGVEADFRRAGEEAERIAILLAFDARLKAAGRNPGTSADLTVASLLVDTLMPKLA